MLLRRPPSLAVLACLVCATLPLAACGKVDGNAAPPVGAGGSVDDGDLGGVAGVDLGAVDGATAVEVDAGGARCGATAQKGDYCGNDKIVNGDPDTLYTCAAADAPPTDAKRCVAGCIVAPAGSDDYCKLPTTPKSYRLPWMPGTTMQLTQDCNDSCCSDHVGSDEYAWDWANGSSFLVRAARGGTITHLKINSTTGCATTACSVDVNMLVIDHGDGTQAIYMHLKGDSAQPGVTCGAQVKAGQPLAWSGTTGHSTGVHLHFQVSQVHPDAPTCECGASGKQCATTFNPFPDTWVNAPYHTVPIAFVEWPTASTCSNRRITMPAATN
jgi:hypothetical protein